MSTVVKTSVVLAALALTGASLSPLAQTSSRQLPPVFMTEADMTSAFGGKTIDGHYADGVTFSETYHADGRIEYREKGRDMNGRWLVRAATFCTLYDTSPTGGCYRVTRRGANCFEFYFVARDDKQAERGPGQPSWTAQAWVKGQPETCKEEPTV